VNVLQAALDAMAAGISVMPPTQDGQKRPDGNWKHAQSTRADESRILDWYRPGRTGVGWVPGAVSGNLEVLDFDDRSIWAEFQKLCCDAGLGQLLDRMVAGYFEHSPNGAHLIYRCPTIDTNRKLAQRPDKKAVIETRGEGGYIIVAPSHGSVHPLRGSYVLQSGGVATIATISPEERRALFDVARIFDECPRVSEVRPPQAAISAAGRPGDDFNARATWEQILEPHGWVKVFSRLGASSWRRPGKDHGVSATTNYADSGFLYVFSTSTPFEPERGYSKFSARALLEYAGDFSAAAHALSLEGYGIEIPDVDLSGILSPRSSAIAPELSRLLRVPGLVGDIAEWIVASSNKPQPVLAVAAATATVSALIGRKARTESNLRSNLYVLGVGETGCGKERARQAINSLFVALGVDRVLGDSFASDSAVETAIGQSPVRLYLIDEMGYFLGTMRDELAPAHVRSIVPVLLRMYSSSEGVYRKRTYAQSEAKKDDVAYVDQPCLSIYGTTVPSNFYANVTKSHISNGLLSRLLVFESDNPDPEMQWPPLGALAAPAPIVAGCKLWVDRSICSDPEAGNLEARAVPSPLIVKASADACDVRDDLEQTMRRRRREERGAGRDPGPFTRVATSAMKLALIRAAGINPEHPEITESDAEWGCGLAWCLTERFMAKVGDAAPENKVEAASQRVLGAIKQAGSLVRQQLIRRARFLSSRQLDDVLRTLAEAGDILIETEITKGRPRTTYVDADKERMAS
jgi:hypothetical protein